MSCLFASGSVSPRRERWNKKRRRSEESGEINDWKDSGAAAEGMNMNFTKMQGIGNDYVYVDCTRESVKDPSALARRVSDRHFGIGSDGLVLILKGEKADFRMRMFNADGSEAQMCGNASRCVARYVHDRGLTEKTEMTLETGSGVRNLKLNMKDGRVTSVTVDMGEPETDPAKIPVLPSAIGLAGNPETVLNAPMEVNGKVFGITCVSMGNPHCVIFQDEVESWPIETWGPAFENHPAFPERINTEFARIIDRKHIRMRVWERGSGETMACGTGACATLAAAVLNQRTERCAILCLNGGELEIEWDEKTGHIFMTGPAEFVFDGSIETEE